MVDMQIENLLYCPFSPIPFVDVRDPEELKAQVKVNVAKALRLLWHIMIHVGL